MAPLLILLLCIGGIAAAPPSTEQAYRDARGAAERGLFDQALVQARAALTRAGPLEDEWVYSTRVLQAEVQYKQAGPEKSSAEEFLDREVPPQFRNSEAAVRRLLALAQVKAAAEREAARRYVEKALQLAEAKHPQLLWQVHLTFTHFDRTTAQKQARLATALKSAQHFGNRLAIAVVQASQAFNFTGQAQYREAIEAGEKALATLRALEATGRIASVAGNLGWAYSEIGDWETARSWFTEAEAAATRAGTPKSRLLWENQLGNVHFFDRDYAKAEQYYTRALRTAREVEANDDIPMVQTNLARNALEHGLTDEASRLVAAALAWPSKADKDGARIVDARIATVTGDFARAESTLRAAMKSKDPARRVEAQTYLAQLYVRMRRNELAESNFLTAIAAVREARDSIKERFLRFAFFNTSIDLFNSYIDFLLNDNRIEDALAATELIRAQSLAEGLGVQATSRKLDARAIAKQRGAVILSYWLSPVRSHVWVITGSEVRYAPLADAGVIEKEARAYRRTLLTHNGTLLKSGDDGQRLYRAVIAPVAGRIPRASRVYVIASGALHGINFETLVVPGQRPHYWIEDVVVSNASSLQLLARNSTRKHDGSMLIVGDPPEVAVAFPRLPSAQSEIDRVGQHFPRRVVLTGANATPAAYRASVSRRFGYLHFVAHGLSSARPLDSCVILGRDGEDNYRLTGRDILAQKLEARLVTLSSCHGAGERMYAGEGLVGLAWAFLGAGASEVVAALWEVNDSATPGLMDRMYTGIAAGAEPAVALRNAKLTLLQGKGVHQMPRYWAPFVLYSGS
ncbi:MAG TPA: CHAT domain-containing tetratricopeptide repeat protein [Thermoanaerobaculia bacterium]|nr:CHAT domain-containing tetratricopeptide repeat protein [Thermoanaerobaculia bacterium]